MLKKNSEYICLSVIVLDSVFTTDKNCYPQVFLEKVNILIKGKNSKHFDDIEKSPKYITNVTKVSSDSDRENSYK